METFQPIYMDVFDETAYKYMCEFQEQLFFRKFGILELRVLRLAYKLTFRK